MVTRVEISGPATIVPGQSAQYTAQATFTDGTSRDVTAEAAWESHNTQVLTIVRGAATALQRGEADLLVRFGSQVGFKQQVLVLPEGTFRVRGVITDAGLGLSGARVEVIAGSGTGLSDTSDASCIGCGSYHLYGVAGPSELRVSKVGYTTKTVAITVTNHEQLNIELVPEALPADPSGSYRLTITAADECRATLPSETWERSYDATLTRDGRKVKVTLDGPALDADAAGTGKGFLGAVESDRLFFLLLPAGFSPWDLYVYHASITERLSTAPRKLGISGSINAPMSAASFTGTLDGVFQVFEIVNVEVRPFVECRSAAHRVVFQR